MNSRNEQIEALIGSLDPVLPNDPPASWRPACEALRRELLAAEKVERRLQLIGPAIALTAFIGFEAKNLPVTVTALLGCICVCLLAAAFAPNARSRLVALGLIAPLVAWLSLLAPNAHGYVVLGLLLSLSIKYLLSRLYPALEHRERIAFLLDYFGLQTETKNAPA